MSNYRMTPSSSAFAIDIRDNFPQIARALREHAEQVPFATALALTLTAKDVKVDEQAEMRRVFDRPTPWTLNSLYVKGATKANLTARVWLKDYDDPKHYLLPQIYGGSRPQKRLEVLLTRLGVMQPTDRAVPGAGAKLDAYGNMSRGQVQQIVSQLKGFYLAGASQNATNSKRSRAKRAKEAYFPSTGKGTHPLGTGSWIRGRHEQHLPRGVWLRRSFGPLGTAVKPVLLFVSHATYRGRWDFDGIAEATIDRVFERHFNRSFARAVESAR